MYSTLLTTAAIVATASAAFDPLSKNNVATYWGQGANQARLIETCKNSAYDIINVGFVTVFPDQDPSGWPGTNFGNACWGDVYQNAKGVNSSLLKTCPNIGPDVIECQKTYGKKIFLSIGGGADPDYYIKTVQSARQFANFLWAAFGPKSASTADVPRPWGDAGVDGFDFDIESVINPPPASNPNYQKAFYADMIKRFKVLFGADTSKSYYISGSPQCVIPDPHFTDVLSNSWFDFLFIQFYNTDGCSARDGIKKINGRGTADISYLQWVAAKSLNPNVRMSIGLPAAKAASRLGTYYLNPTEAQKLIKKFYKEKLFGGVMLWEATFAANNKVCSTDYGTWMKNILKGQAAGKDIATTCAAKRALEGYGEEPEAAWPSVYTSSATLASSSSLAAPVTETPSYETTESASSPAASVTDIPSYGTSSSASSSSMPVDAIPSYGASESVSSSSAPVSDIPSYGTSSSASSSSAPVTDVPSYGTSSSASSSTPAVTDVPSYGTSESASSPASPGTTSAPGYWPVPANSSSAAVPSSEAAPSYPAWSEESSSAVSSPASPESSSAAPSSPADSYPQESSQAEPSPASPALSSPASEACGSEVTVTVKETSTLYVTATEGAPSEDTTSLTTIQSTSTIYNTHTAYLTRYPSESAPAGSGSSPSSPSSPEASSPADYENSPVDGESSSSPSSPEASSPADYENGPVGGEGSTSSSVPAAPAYSSHGHQHGQGYTHSHGNGPQSTTTVVNVVSVIPVPVTSGGAAQPTGAPYPYAPGAGNGTAVGTASASASAFPTYGGPQQQTGGAGGLGVSLGLVTLVSLLAVVLL